MAKSRPYVNVYRVAAELAAARTMRKIINAQTGEVVHESNDAARWYEQQCDWRLARDESEVMPELRAAWGVALAVRNDPLYVVPCGA